MLENFLGRAAGEIILIAGRFKADKLVHGKRSNIMKKDRNTNIVTYSIAVDSPITPVEPLPPLPKIPKGALVVVEGRAYMALWAGFSQASRVACRGNCGF